MTERGLLTPITAVLLDSKALRDTSTPKAPVNAGAWSPAAALESDRYVLDREIARGGMGRVFAGRDLKLQREVAVKVLHQVDDDSRARFEREALLCARLQHPGIVPVYDMGCWPGGEPFLVMRLVHGRPLLKVMHDTESVADRLSLLPMLIAVADALAYAHDRGIIHRDLKPSNVLVGAFGDVAIIDWGLAKDLASGAEEPPTRLVLERKDQAQADLTQTGSVLGTPQYMAPEQAAGLTVDARADVYALGAIIYQALCGAAPAQASAGLPDTPRTTALVPLSALEPKLPRRLLAIVNKALAVAPQDRYPSAFELADDLRRFLSHQPISAQTQQGWLVRMLRRVLRR